MVKKNRPYTWDDLKEFVNSLPKKELIKHITWWGDEEGGRITGASQLKEDHIYSEEGCQPLSDHVLSNEYEPTEELDIAYLKGTPILYI